MPRVDLHGRAIAITGASSGIGRATAIACARAGMDVAIGARREAKLEEVAGEIRSIGQRAEVIPIDVGDESQCAAFVDRAHASLGRLDAVFANAGYGVEQGTLEMPLEAHRRMFEVNFWGSLRLIIAAAPLLAEARPGHALLCSSCLAKIGLPYYAAYCATKAAQDYYGRALRCELRGRGVAVSTVHPVGTSTEFFDRLDEQSGGSKLLDPRSMGRLQTPDRVARAIVKRLRSGKGGEVWTSLPTRLMLAASVAAPGLTDWALRKKFDARLGAR